MLLDRFLPRIDFDSYEDFKKNYKVKVPDNFNFGFDIVDAWAEQDESKKALLWINDFGEERVFTFADVRDYSNRIANFFVSLGIKKGDKVMLLLKQRYQYWMCAVAIHKIGAVLIPASVQLTKKDLVYRINAADVKLIISTDDHTLAQCVEDAEKETNSLTAKVFVGSERTGWLNLDIEADKFPPEFERPDGESATMKNDLFLIYFTSGTTGMPKMVAHDYSYPLGHITTAKYWHHVEEDGLHLTVSDSGWAKFGWGKIYGQWIAGATIFAYDMEKFVPAKMLEIMQKYPIVTFCAPPTMYRFFIKEDLTKYNLSSIKHATIAGEPLNPEVFNQFYDATGLKVHEGFGQSESSVMLANFRGWIEPKPGSMGKPSPLYDIDLLDENGNSVPTGEEGELVIKMKHARPLGLFIGYYEGGEIRTDHIENDVYNTHDLAWRDSDGYYWFVGRSDDVIKCSGYRIGPFEVESALLTHKAVVECAITAAPDPIRGQIVKATVVLAKGYVPSEELVKELQNHVKTTTAPYKYPRIVEFVDELPKTLGGKIKRAQLRHEAENKK
ncbi:MAG: AMP-binding protein [Clostridia bacterium]|nr:AMP-binding protein [Clostridia bacterium]